MFVQFQISFHVNIAIAIATAIAISYAHFTIPKSPHVTLSNPFPTLHIQYSAEVFMLEPQQLPVQLREQLLVPPLAQELGPEQPPAHACSCRR
jgi:hypothetical protein